jgi:DNA-binding NarL/FixJ family response regulator
MQYKMARGASATESGHSVSSILVVDNDPGESENICRLLADAGFETSRVASGEEALVFAHRGRPQLVVLEVSLPGVSGYEVLRKLREQFGERLPVILISGDRADPLDRVAGLLLGADDYLGKPFAPDELTARARRLLVRSSVEAEIPETDEPKLTRREGDVLRLLAQGLDQPAIAKELVISPKTVSSHIQHILGKLGVHSRAQAVAAAHRGGYLGGASA